MARRRTPRKASASKIAKVRRYITEALEPRKYLVVLHEGNVFEFWADGNQMERVVVEGNPGSTTIELIGAHSNDTVGLLPGTTPPLSSMDGRITAGVNFGDVGAGLPPAALNNQGGGGTGNTNAPTFTDDIYAIYVSKSDASTRIAVAGVPPLTQANRLMQPFTGSVTLLVRPSAGGPNISVSVANTGTAILGARTYAPKNQQGGGGGGGNQFPANEPIYAPVTFPSGTFPTVPPNITSLGAGLYVAQGNNLGEFLWGGTMLGNVDVKGSVQTFYGGWIVTGNSFGEAGVTTSVPQNFNVDGDLQSLISNGSIGTNTDSGLADLARPTYLSGFDLHVGGRVGMVKSLDSFVGGLDVTNSPTAPGFNGLPYRQLDVVSNFTANNSPWDQAIFAGDTLLKSDTFQGAQFLAPINANGDIVVNGGGIVTDFLNQTANFVVYYGVPLMAGQTVDVRLDDTTNTGLSSGSLRIGVFDSQRRLVASDYNRSDPLSVAGSDFLVTAKLPGIYYFVVTSANDNTFTPNTGTASIFDYTLYITGAGNLAIGGLCATNNVLGTGNVATSNSGFTGNYHVANGDFGATFAGGVVISGVASGSGLASFTYVIDDGDLRAVEGSSIGNGTSPSGSTTIGGVTTSTGFLFGNGPTGFVPNGSVGMLRATSTANGSGQAATGVLVWNSFGLALGGTVNAPLSVAIGGDYQMVDAANLLYCELVARGNIGTVRANSMGSSTPSYFQVNAANDPAKHGTIDLIDCTTNFGILGGGPAIVTGPGGNCRYIHVGQNAAVFRDPFFGGGTPEATLYQPGETAVITDDSGANVIIAPQNVADSLSITTFPIRGSGGAAIMRIEVTNTTNQAAAQGVNVNTTGGGSAEIGSIILDGAGTATTAGAAAPPPPAAAANAKFVLPTLGGAPTINPTAPMDVTLTGSATLDVYEITGIATAADGSLVAGRGNVTSITNNTSGSEMPVIHLNSLGTLSTNGTIGLVLKKNTPATVTGNFYTHRAEDGASGAPYTYPLLEVSELVRVLGNVVSISAGGGVGNIYTGVISNGGAPNDPIPAANSTPPAIPAGVQLRGTSGQIGSVAGPIIGAVVAAGTINSVTARGIGWQGSGSYAPAGIFSTGLLGPITVNGDDRGMIISTIGQMGLTVINGSLQQAVVGNFSRFDYAQARSLRTNTPGTTGPFTRPTLDLVSINIKGNGGIIGTSMVGQHIGTISTSDTGFGIFDSIVTVLGDGTINSVSAGGYGLRNTTISGGATTGSIIARGDGTNLPVTNFPSNLRYSETGAQFDPVTGQSINELSDISFFLGTTAATPRIDGTTESGVIEDTSVTGSRDVGTVTAWSIRGRSLANASNSVLALGGVTTFNVANSVNNINVVGPVDGLTIVTGRTSKYRFGGDVGNLSMTIAGPIGDVVFNSSLLGSSEVVAQGPSGRIKSVTVHGNMSGTISAVRDIGKVTIDGSMTGLIHGATLNTLKLSGGIGNGSLTIDTNVGTIQTTGDLGLPGNTLTINGSLKKLQVGKNLNTNVSVGGNLGQLLVGGSVLSGTNVHVTNTITTLKVNGDLEAGSIISAHLIKKKLIKGQTLGTITTA